MDRGQIIVNGYVFVTYFSKFKISLSNYELLEFGPKNIPQFNCIVHSSKHPYSFQQLLFR